MFSVKLTMSLSLKSLFKYLLAKFVNPWVIWWHHKHVSTQPKYKPVIQWDLSTFFGISLVGDFQRITMFLQLRLCVECPEMVLESEDADTTRGTAVY